MVFLTVTVILVALLLLFSAIDNKTVSAYASQVFKTATKKKGTG